jgi:opacity protein-like surface antigen
MRDRLRIRHTTFGIVIALVVLCPSTALADATLFIGANTTPSSRWVRGGAVGVSLLIVGFEFEYSNTSEQLEDQAPSLRTGMANVLLQTPFSNSLQFYGTVGGGIYRERLAEDQETHFGANVGGGVKVSLAGPLRLRLDYRVFTLQGSPRHSRPQRIYAGLNLMF